MKILITGDLVVNRPYKAEERIDPELVKLFSNSDYNIVNLEAPVTASEQKITKTGPHLKSHPESTHDVLKTLNIHIAALANNHIKDYGEQGVLDTIAFCQNKGVNIMGAGKNVVEAAQPMVLDTPEGTIAIINISENEWASAEENRAGANGMCLIKDTRGIQQAKREHDFVFVIVHGGHEYYNLPSPRMQDQYRFYAEQGADLVVGHHTHCINGYEIYNSTPIFYSLGNFLFTKTSAYKDWYTGLLLEIEVVNKEIYARLRPVQQSKETFNLYLLSGHEQDEALQKINEYSAALEDRARLVDAWQKFATSKLVAYQNYWSPLSFINNRYLKGVLHRLKINFATQRGQALYLNLMRCEAHHDLSKEIMKKSIRKAEK